MATLITTRKAKGSALEWDEVDANFTNLQTSVDASLRKANNLSDVNDPASARVNIGLGEVNNTADANKPVSTATAAAIQSVRNDLASDAGSSLVCYLPAGTGAVATDVQSKLHETVSVKDFGAVGDGVVDDTAAVQAFYEYLAANGGSGYIQQGEYLITTGIVLNNPAMGFYVRGSGDESVIKLRGTAGSASLTALSIVGPHDTVMENFLIDCGYSVTGYASHGYSFSDSNRVTMRGVNVIDHRNSAGLMFLQAATATATSQNLNGDYRNCYIIDSYSDSKGNGQNGFLLESMYASAIINCHVKALDRTGSPCFGLQLKNECRYSQIIGGSAEGCLGGVALGGEAAGSAGYFCNINDVIVKNCLDGGIFGKSTNCKVSLIVDMADSAINQYAVNVAGFNVGLDIRAVVSNIPASKYAARISSRGTRLSMSLPDGIGTGMLALLEPSVDYTYIEIDRINGLTGVTNPLPYITDNSGSSTNLVFLKPASGTLGLANMAAYYFHTVGGGQSFISYSGASPQFNLRMNGADHLNLTTTWLSPVTDNAKTLGRATQRWSVVYAGTGTIDTSDEREKQQIKPIDAEAIRAWAKVDYCQFKFNDAVEAKGDGARWHFGVIAQRVEEAFKSEGLDPFAYGVLCYDEWPEQTEVKDDDGNITQEYRPAGNRYGIRYEEAIALECAYLRSRLNGVKS